MFAKSKIATTIAVQPKVAASFTRAANDLLEMMHREDARHSSQIHGYRLCGELGKGGNGFVMEAENIQTQEHVAIKFIHRHKVNKAWLVPDGRAGHFPYEVLVMKELPHPNMVQYIKHFQTGYFYCLVMELHGAQWDMSSVGRRSRDLFECVESSGRLEPWQAKRVLVETLSCLLHLKQHHVFHRDIKDENILVDDEYHVKLIDFGSAIRCSTLCCSAFSGTAAFAAPELQCRQCLQRLHCPPPYCLEKADVWALGVVLFIMLTGTHPPKEGPIAKYLTSYVPTQCVKLIEGMLNKDPNRRYTFDEIKNHPWCQAN